MLKSRNHRAGIASKILRISLILLWELPQNILGLGVYFAYRKSVGKAEILHYRAFLPAKKFGISLGWFVFFFKNRNPNGIEENRSKAHEFGHAIQSQLLGPLYLPLVGLPSLIRIIYGRLYRMMYKEVWRGYYKGYPEHWADTLGKKYF